MNYFKIYYMGFEYYTIFSFLLLGLALGFILFLFSNLLVFKTYDVEKLSAYECGFNPFSDSRGKFDVRFYLVGILFIIFDLEIVYLFPWASSLSRIGFFGYWVMMFFLFLLILGFVYEWMKGALDWE